MAWQFAVRAVGGEIHRSRGTNIVPAFPEGTLIEAFAVNGIWSNVTGGPVPSTGQDLVIPFDVLRALRPTAPRAA